ncbi:MAG: TonB-dependent receptor [Prevotella sp.]|nr:TonB-dependent receptor [Prevotella sp.]
MKKIVSIIGMMLLITLSAAAQTTTIKGVLTDSISGETEPFATVRVFKDNNMEKPVAMSATDLDGNIKQEVEGEGEFVITFSAVGKNTVSRKLTLGENADIDLGVVYITDDSKMLEGVEVVAHKTLVKMETDKMSYNVQDDTESKSATVLDMLRKVPMVTVDGQDNISVNGTSSFKVYVDGKPNVMMSSNPSQVFKSMPASVVKSIEVVTNPGAKYDAEGAGGVLNIIMNKQNPMAQESLNGYSATARMQVSTKGVGAGLFANAQQGKLSVGVNGFYTKSKNETEVEMTREQYSDFGTMTTKYYQDGTTKTPFLMGSLTLGYELDPMSSLNATFSVNSFNMKNTGHPVTTMSGGIYGDGFSYGNEMIAKNKRTSFTASADYSRFFNAEHTKLLTLTYQFTQSPTKSQNETIFDAVNTEEGNPFDVQANRYTDNREKSTEHTVQVDYTTPLSATQTLNTGVKYLNRNNSSDSKYYLNDVYNDAMSMDYLYKNNILAGYAELESKWGTKWSTKAGLRYEHTWQDVEYKKGNGEDFSKDYGSLVPSASLSYSLAPTQNLGLTYNMRISRPGISYLNPYIDRSSPTQLTYGNPDLDVEKTHNVQLVYNSFSQKFMMNATLRYSFCDNAIEQYSFYDSSNLLNTTYGNMMKRHQLGLNLYANYSLTTSTRLMLNGGVTYADMKSKALDTSNSGWQGNFMVGLQQKLPWDVNLNVNYITSTKSYTLQGWSTGFNLMMGTLSKSFLNDKVTVSVAAVTGLNKGGKLNLDSYSEGKDFVSKQAIGVNISQLVLNVSVTLGNNKRQMSRMHQTKVTDDYIERQSTEEQINGQGGIGGGNMGGGF